MELTKKFFKKIVLSPFQLIGPFSHSTRLKKRNYPLIRKLH